MTQYVSLFDSLHMFKYVNSTNPIGMEPLGLVMVMFSIPLFCLT